MVRGVRQPTTRRPCPQSRLQTITCDEIQDALSALVFGQAYRILRRMGNVPPSDLATIRPGELRRSRCGKAKGGPTLALLTLGFRQLASKSSLLWTPVLV